MVSSTKEHIIHIREKNLCANMQTIANQVGVTREWVRQVLKEANKPTKAFHPTYLCNYCGKVTINKHRTPPKFCSRQCLQAYHKTQTLTLECENCGRLFTRSSSQTKETARNKHTFCNRRCFAQWVVKVRKVRGSNNR